MQTSSRPGFSPERSQLPRTPPQTPYAIRQRLERSASPASMKSIPPADTISPSKKSEGEPPQDNVRVEELHEGDAGYTDIDAVYPADFEEPESGDANYDTASTSSDENASENEFTHHFSRLDCGDAQEMQFERERRSKHAHRRTGSRVFKRKHSQSVKADVEMTDPDAVHDQDRNSSARRLRRRVRGPEGVPVVSEEMQRTPPPSRESAVASNTEELWQQLSHNSGATTQSSTDAMQMDDSE